MAKITEVVLDSEDRVSDRVIQAQADNTGAVITAIGHLDGRMMSYIEDIINSRDRKAKRSNKKEAAALDVNAIELVKGKAGKLGRGR